MNRYYYDLHIHSCLSPCGDDEMTPNNIAGIGTLAGLNVMALTDHNTSENCPAFFRAAKANGIIPIAGMELTTSEDIHVVCLFEKLDDAMAFSRFVDGHRIKVPNRKEIFGNQLIMDENDEVIGEEEFLLINATDIPVDSVKKYVKQFSGICYPAHIDRESNGIIATLSCIPEECGFTCVEYYSSDAVETCEKEHPEVIGKRIVVSSDSHNLWSIRDKENYFDIDDEPYSSDKVRHEIFKILSENF